MPQRRAGVALTPKKRMSPMKDQTVPDCTIVQMVPLGPVCIARDMMRHMMTLMKPVKM